MDDHTRKLENTPPLGKSDEELRDEGADSTVPSVEERAAPGGPVPVPAATAVAGGATSAHHGSPVIATYDSGDAIHDQHDQTDEPDEDPKRR